MSKPHNCPDFTLFSNIKTHKELVEFKRKLWKGDFQVASSKKKPRWRGYHRGFED